MRGRKPQPAGVRALKGARTRPYHKDRLPEQEDQQPEAEETSDTISAIAPPAALVQAERAYWNVFAPLLASAKVLTSADVETLADYCRACVAVDERGRRLRTEFKKKKIDNQTVRMLDAQQRGWVEKKTKLATELGLTAVSRTRLAWSGNAQVVDPVKKPKSKLAQLQEQAASLRRPVGVK